MLRLHLPALLAKLIGLFDEGFALFLLLFHLLLEMGLLTFLAPRLSSCRGIALLRSVFFGYPPDLELFGLSDQRSHFGFLCFGLLIQLFFLSQEALCLLVQALTGALLFSPIRVGSLGRRLCGRRLCSLRLSHNTAACHETEGDDYNHETHLH